MTDTPFWSVDSHPGYLNKSYTSGHNDRSVNKHNLQPPKLTIKRGIFENNLLWKPLSVP